MFNGKPLADSELLSLAGVEEEQTLYILGRLLGGGKKRKKKTYTKPKKQKHKHKKIKLRVLKFYKVGRWVGWVGGWGWGNGHRYHYVCTLVFQMWLLCACRHYSSHLSPCSATSCHTCQIWRPNPLPHVPAFCFLSPLPTTTHYAHKQVDDSGKVSRLRKQCPQCGPGIFMATHFDRVYCGKCTTTYLVSREQEQQEQAG